ncbi:MAG: hypothetical protein ACYTGN_14215 [Planctomycetota bacterium]|jgi:hypothetical protein
MRKLFERYERAFMIGLVLFVLVIFTVTDDIVDALSGRNQGTDPGEAAGSFSILKGERVDVSYAEYERARQSYSRAQNIIRRGGGGRVRPSQVWTHLLLLAAADKEGLTVSDQELSDLLQVFIPPQLFQDRARYKETIRRVYRTSPRQFEESFREFWIAQRVRQIYAESYEIAPPATREDMVKQYTTQNIEFARASWVRLSAASFLDAADKELKTADDPDKELKTFFEQDAAVKAARFKFRHPRRYEVEFVVAVHKMFEDDAALKRLTDLMKKTWPAFDVAKIEPKDVAQRDYFDIYQDRLLEQVGKALDEIEYDEEEVKEPEPKDGDEEVVKDPEEPEQPGDPEKKDGDEPQPEKNELSKAEKESRLKNAFRLVQKQVRRELIVKGVFVYLRNEAAKDPSKGFKLLFDALKNNDEPKNPVCGADQETGLIQFLTFEAPLSGEEIEQLAPHDMLFTHNGRHRVTRMSSESLPAVSEAAVTVGMEAHGRMIIRLVKMESERRKTYEELDQAEKTDLKKSFYLPANARERAEARLEELRKKFESGEVAPTAFRESGEALGGAVISDEWILASTIGMADPSDKALWPDEYRRMRDRHFLRRRLANVLETDRTDPKYKAGSFMPVMVDSRSDDDDDPGAAYLVMLLERKRPTADTMPLEEFESYINVARQQRGAQDRERWSEDFKKLMRRFDMKFFGSMLDSVNDELDKIDQAKKTRRRP